jgi:hypothetical protein
LVNERVKMRRMIGATKVDAPHSPTAPSGGSTSSHQWIEVPSPAQPPAFLFHTAFCCSTLIARCLDQQGHCLSLKELGLLMDLANALRMAPDAATRARVREATRSGLRLLARPQVAEERVLLKPANAAAGLHGTMLELMPESRGVLLFSDLRAFMTSILKKGETGRAFVRTLYNIFSLDGTGLSRIPSRQAMGFTDMQVAALVWRHQMETHAGLLQAHGDRLMVLDCEDFLSRPAAVLQQLDSHLQLGLGDERIEAVVAGDLLQRNAKFADDDFDAATRRSEAARVEGQWGEDLDRIVDWTRGLTLDRPLEGALAAFGPR